jgi:Transcriptional Coactivator p15 (PC4)
MPKSEGDKLILEWRANKAETFRVMLRQLGSVLLVDFRRWFRDADGKLCPSKKGVSFKPADIKRLRKALRTARKKIEQRVSRSRPRKRRR